MTVDRSRRTLLKKGLIGGTLLTVAGGALWASRHTLLAPLPPEGLKVLSPAEYSVVHAVAGRLIPARAGFPSSVEVRVAFNADR